jgi:hypothetical protein
MAAKNQKFGRNAKRSPSMAAYRNTNRMSLNKDKAIEKDKQFKEKCAARKAAKKIIRGWTRWLRRHPT